MVQWGVLRDGPVKGTFVAPSRRIDLPDAISEMLLQAILVSNARGMPLSHLTGHPALFPFEVHVTAASLRKSGRIQIQRQGDQTDFVELEYPSRSIPAQPV